MPITRPRRDPSHALGPDGPPAPPAGRRSPGGPRCRAVPHSPASGRHEHHRTWRYEMHAVVVYESFWGNTAAIARAIAEGMGPEATAMTTDQATADVVSGADMVVAGAPVLGFRLPTDEIRDQLYHESGAPKPADTLHPAMRAWLLERPPGP